MELFHDPEFWGFATALIGALRWLLKVGYGYRLQAIKTEHSSQIELLRILQSQVKEIKPIVERHSQIINSFQATAQEITNSENRITRQVDDMSEMGKALKVQFVSFKDTALKNEALMSNFTKEIEGIKTEILQLKKGSGNIYVTRKKE